MDRSSDSQVRSGSHSKVFINSLLRLNSIACNQSIHDFLVFGPRAAWRRR
ncbi:hypothetical protein [Arthrobacter methylotrophus]